MHIGTYLHKLLYSTFYVLYYFILYYYILLFMLLIFMLLNIFTVRSGNEAKPSVELRHLICHTLSYKATVAIYNVLICNFSRSKTVHWTSSAR